VDKLSTGPVNMKILS